MMTYVLIFLGMLALGVLMAPLILRYYRRSRRKNKKISSRSTHENYESTDDRYLETDPSQDSPNPLFAPPIVEETIDDIEERLPPPSAKPRAFLKEEIATKDPDQEEPLFLKRQPPELNRVTSVKREHHSTSKKKSSGDLHQSELIIPIYIVAHSEFDGNDIFPILEELGLRYGEMKIFHHYGIGEVKIKKPVFSIANMMEPGTFDPNATEGFVTPGLVLFMRLPGPFGGRVAFELMLSTGQKIAEILEGSLEDEHHHPLAQQTIQTLRERIAHFEQRDTRLSLLKRFS